jgi:hypothetical protein
MYHYDHEMADLIISFDGLDADQNHLDAYSGIESAAGLARALTLVAHYAATGTIRHRFPFDDSVKIYLEGTEDGSFNWRLKVVAGTLALGLGTNAIYDLTKLVFTRAIGGEPVGISRDVSELNEAKSGDIDALVEAVEPALKKGHYGIGETATKIIIRSESKKEVIVTFDRSSKQYLVDSVKADQTDQDVSISALNANDRTGRAFFLDLKRTIPFTVSREADASTLAVLSSGLDQYVNKNPAPIRIRFTPIEAVDGRLKRVIIYAAEDISEER